MVVEEGGGGKGNTDIATANQEPIAKISIQLQIVANSSNQNMPFLEQGYVRCHTCTTYSCKVGMRLGQGRFEGCLEQPHSIVEQSFWLCAPVLIHFQAKYFHYWQVGN